MATFTSSLPDDLLQQLSETAEELKKPKNSIIEKALRIYLRELKKAQYAKSYQRAAKDEDMVAMAEEGMGDYFRMLEDFDKE